VDDCINCAKYLCNLNLADKNNLFISGSSSGGYTLLCSLAFRDPFYKAASCLYGISDLVALSEHTHKFESFYDQGLIGADINTPEGRKLYEKRSPIHSADHIKTPTIFFHGDKDFVVSVEQTLEIADVLKKNGVKHEVHVFEGEGHGIKKGENVVTLLTNEIIFFDSLLCL
jgi:dipeptidyl aminopeptidase/acylaminoacyl peptidase